MRCAQLFLESCSQSVNRFTATHQTLIQTEMRNHMKQTVFTIGLLLAAVAVLISSRGFQTTTHASLIAAPVVINFEDVAPGPVSNQYANLGVLFNQPRILNYQSMPGFAHSGTKAIEQCYATEFCNVPFEMSFTSAQRRVKVWVGYSYALTESRTVMLRALDANGVQIGQVTTVFAPSTSPRPVNTPLEITLPNARIRKALVSFSPADISPYSLVVDDVEFDSAGPPPPCPATVNPTLTSNQPVQNQVVQFNGFLLDAQATSQDPLATSLTLTVHRPGGSPITQTLQLSNGKYGPTMMNGYLLPGDNTVILKFQDCKGTAETIRNLRYTPIPDGTRFEMLGIEVNQATQETGNSVPLVAGKPGMARVFLRIQSPLGPSATIKDVFGRLTARRRIGTVLGDYLPPGEIKATNMIVVNTSNDLNAKRGVLNATVNFNLPANWVTQGELHLSFRPEIKDSPSSPSSLPCTNCENLFPSNSQPRLMTFHPTRKMNLILAPYIYEPSSNPPFPLSAELLFTPAGALQWTNNVYPLPGNFPSNGAGINLIRILPMRRTTRNMQTAGGKSDFLDDLRDVYAALKSQGGIPSDTRLLGMVPCGCGGQAELSGHVGFADTWAQENGPVPAANFEGYGATWAHELGHTYGRHHGGNWHGEENGGGYDPNFPYFHGGIGAPGIAFITEWWRPGGTPYFISPGVLNPLGRHAHDFMSYGHTDPLNSGLWVSPYTYYNLWKVFRIQTRRAIETITRNTVELDAEDIDAEPAASSKPVEKLVVMGRLSADGSAHLQPFYRSVTDANTSSGASGEFGLELLDDQGRVLTTHRFDAKAVSHMDDGTLSFTEFVQWNEKTKRIVLKRKDQVLAERAVSTHAPTVRVLSPNGGESLGSEVNILWEADDRDGDSLTYSVFYNNGVEKTWWPVATNLTTTSVNVDTSLWPGSKQGRIMVRATDGVNSTEDVSDGDFIVAQKNPMVAIINAQTLGDQKSEGEAPLMGFAYDPEDGILPDSSLIWSSDRDGLIEKGRLIKSTRLSSGTHTITLTVTDSQGQTSTYQAKKTVPAPVVK
jgi:hypothetical protein